VVSQGRRAAGAAAGTRLAVSLQAEPCSARPGSLDFAWDRLHLTFGRGFAVGILITLISCACYVGTWEIVYFNFMPDFAEKYAAYSVERAKASGASQQKLDEMSQEAKTFKVRYDNPAINVAMTFMEVFPIGLVVTLTSAGILRKKVSEPDNFPSPASGIPDATGR